MGMLDGMAGAFTSLYSNAGSGSSGSGWMSGLADAFSGGGGGGWASAIGSLFGGGDKGNGGSSNIWGSILSGLGGAAEGYLSGKDAKEALETRGKEDRKTIDFEYGLKDYYTQKDKVRKRAALDTYGQFSLTDRFAPGMVAAPPVQQPPKPGV
jgi:hypothetical protein